MAAGKLCLPEVHERAVRLVFDHQHEHASQWAAIVSISSKFGMTPQTCVRGYVRPNATRGRRSGLTSEERVRLEELEREVKELRRANEVLKSAEVFSLSSSTADGPCDPLHRRAPGPVRG